MIELSAAIEVKDVEISNLTESLANKTSEVREQEENFKQALVKNQEWEGDYTKLKDSVAKLKVSCIRCIQNRKMDFSVI